jgi:outer membrane receptor for ferrienterochelin and colicin
MRRSLFWCLVVVLALTATTASAQGNPTGAISGQVTDPDGLALPGVVVTATSPLQQGARSVTTSANGDFIIPFLAPGDYAVIFELQGFATHKQTVRVEMAATIPLKVKMALASVTETVNVSAALTEIAQTATVATTLTSAKVEVLPLGRTVTAYTLFAPGVNDNGPSSAIVMSGAMSYENLNMINGVVVNENLRGTTRNLFIEDAIQESKVSTGSISAEYGRFGGGVVNTITKSGGNMFSGSFRLSLNNDSWKALTPFPGDANIDKTIPTYELTFGGPIWKDRLWFFGAGRYENQEVNMTAEYTAYNYIQGDKEYRYEGKGTFAVNAKNTAKVSYIRRRLDTTNNHYTAASAVMDQRSLYNNAQDENLLSANYTGIITSNFFIEGQYSQRNLSMIGTGSQYRANYSDLTTFGNSTPIWDRSRGQARFNSPTFCAVCGSGLEERDNWDGFVKANYFLSTKRFGSHNLVGGFDLYKEKRKNDNYQSGSSFRLQSTGAVIQGAGTASPTVYPILKNDNTTYVEFLPLVGPSKGNDIRTYSGFVNDLWRVNNQLTLNLGLRFDKNTSKDQGGSSVVRDQAFSPRVGLTWDINGKGVWKTNAGFARYVMGISTAIVDAGSTGGRTATFSYYYKGPNFNTAATGPYLTADEIMPQVFSWFFTANGRQDGYPGKLTTRTTPSMPGVTTTVGSGLKAPNNDEFTIGLARQIGQKGTVRLDYLYRKYNDFYGDFRDMTTGKVYEPVSAKYYDLLVVRNTDSVERNYQGLTLMASYRQNARLNFGGNYTLAWNKGSFEGETATDGPVRASANDMPEYRSASWNYPVGYLNGDQRHKVRMWLTYGLPVAEKLGNMDVSLMQRVDSGRGYDLNSTLDSRPYVTNPGYITPTSSVTYYFSERGGATRDTVYRTDLSFNWESRMPKARKARLFFRFVMNNVFNSSTIVGFNTTVQARAQNSAYAAFNPFTDTPVQGVNWGYGPEYGKPADPTDYQTPRNFNFSFGVRF